MATSMKVFRMLLEITLLWTMFNQECQRAVILCMRPCPDLLRMFLPVHSRVWTALACLRYFPRSLQDGNSPELEELQVALVIVSSRKIGPTIPADSTHFSGCKESPIIACPRHAYCFLMWPLRWKLDLWENHMWLITIGLPSEHRRNESKRYLAYFCQHQFLLAEFWEVFIYRCFPLMLKMMIALNHIIETTI